MGAVALALAIRKLYALNRGSDYHDAGVHLHLKSNEWPHCGSVVLSNVSLSGFRAARSYKIEKCSSTILERGASCA